MHAVLITFESSADVDDLKGPFTEYANALQGVSGFVAKTWIRDDSMLGGFHIRKLLEQRDGGGTHRE